MGRTSMQRSLMEFNSRVLAQGTPVSYKANTPEELKKLLFFNRIFLTNSEEMFQRHNVERVIEDYNEEIITYLNNVHNIVYFYCRTWLGESVRIGNHLDPKMIPVGMDQQQYLAYFRRQLEFIDYLTDLVDKKCVREKKEIASCRPIRIRDIFDRDQLAEYPKHSFDEYLHLLQEASQNESVDSIYVTLYRIGEDDTIYNILKSAVENGIYVHVNIELCASGEEEINKKWMNLMRDAGIHVTTYKSGKFKVHSKLTLIVFKNGRAITQIGTGNYHTKTTSQYTDLSLITSDPSICLAALNVFKILDDKPAAPFDKKFLVSRYNARQRITKLIDREAKKGKNGYIAMKCNALDDDKIIEHLEAAADKGCHMDLIVRGVCTWVPNKIHEHLKIRSIVWDKLEHSRVYCFGKDNPTIYIGSMDLVKKKINKRIETLVMIRDPDVLIQICNYLNRYITNTSNSWIQTESGIYVKEN